MIAATTPTGSWRRMLSATRPRTSSSTGTGLDSSWGSVTTVSEMMESHARLRGETTTLFERMREANVLLHEVLTGAHENMARSRVR